MIAPDAAHLATALKRLEADLMNVAMPADAQNRAFLLDRVRQIRARASVEAIVDDPAGSTEAILGLLNDWADILALLRRLDQEAPATRH